MRMASCSLTAIGTRVGRVATSDARRRAVAAYGADMVDVDVGDHHGIDPPDLLRAPQVGQGIRRVEPHASVEQPAAATGVNHHATGADLGCVDEQVDAHSTTQCQVPREPAAQRIHPQEPSGLQEPAALRAPLSNRRRRAPPAPRQTEAIRTAGPSKVAC